MRNTGHAPCLNFKTEEEAAMTQLMIGHSGLNNRLHIMRKHPTGLCQHCYQPETVKHAIMACVAYERERKVKG